MPYRNYIYEYHAKITSGEIVAGKWIKEIYKIIVGGLEKQEYFFNAKAANKAIKFIENFCHHSKGRNDLIKLELWQKAIVSIIFGIQDEEKTRIFREIFIVIGRKNGKSLFASAIIAYMVYLEPEYGQEIYCLAPKLDQATLVYDGFYKMVQAEDELNELAKKRRSDIYYEETNSFVKPIAFNAKKSDGFNPQLVVCDEMAAWSGDAGLKQYEVMKSALGARRQPMILSISTAGYINDSIYDELMKRSTSFLKGNSKERRLLPFLYMIDDVEKWNDIEELKKANPNMGVSVKESFFTDEIAVAENSLSKRAEFLTKYCNIKQNSSIAWLEYATVDGAGVEKTLEDFTHQSHDICRRHRAEIVVDGLCHVFHIVNGSHQRRTEIQIDTRQIPRFHLPVLVIAEILYVIDHTRVLLPWDDLQRLHHNLLVTGLPEGTEVILGGIVIPYLRILVFMLSRGGTVATDSRRERDVHVVAWESLLVCRHGLVESVKRFLPRRPESDYQQRLVAFLVGFHFGIYRLLIKRHIVFYHGLVVISARRKTYRYRHSKHGDNQMFNLLHCFDV